MKSTYLTVQCTLSHLPLGALSLSQTYHSSQSKQKEAALKMKQAWYLQQSPGDIEVLRYYLVRALGEAPTCFTGQSPSWLKHSCREDNQWLRQIDHGHQDPMHASSRFLEDWA